MTILSKNLNSYIMLNTTEEAVEKINKHCKELMLKKHKDYGPSWTYYRPSSMTDKLWIKAARIKSLQEKGVNKVGDSISSEFIGIINYGIMGLYLLEKPGYDNLTENQLSSIFDTYSKQVTDLREMKNHDYGEAWREMRVSSMVDEILVKLCRVKQIEDNDGKTEISEGIDSCYKDIINYALFSLILLK